MLCSGTKDQIKYSLNIENKETILSMSYGLGRNLLKEEMQMVWALSKEYSTPSATR